MSRPFDRTIWTQPGIPFIRDEPDRPFAAAADRIQHMPWTIRRSWLSRLGIR